MIINTIRKSRRLKAILKGSRMSLIKLGFGGTKSMRIIAFLFRRNKLIRFCLVIIYLPIILVNLKKINELYLAMIVNIY